MVAELRQQLDRLVGLAQVQQALRRAVGRLRQQRALVVRRHRLHLLQGRLDVLLAASTSFSAAFLSSGFVFGRQLLAVQLLADAAVEQARGQADLDLSVSSGRRLLVALSAPCSSLTASSCSSRSAEQLGQLEAGVGVDGQRRGRP